MKSKASQKLYYVNYLGCEKRKLDAQRIINYLNANDYKLANKIRDADTIIFLTCAFCQKYEDYSITKMEKIYNEKQQNSKFIVGGCLTAINPNRFHPYPNIIQIQALELEQLDSILQTSHPIELIPDPNITIFDNQQKCKKINKITEFEDEIESYKDSTLDNNLIKLRTPAQNEYEQAKLGYKIRINWGCLGNCAYCVTKLAEKELKSKAESLILEEFQNGLKEGYSSFFFTGGDTGAYGLDIRLNIVKLCEKILSIPGCYKIHFHDFGIHWLQKFFGELLPLFKKYPEKLGCFSFPIQSGSNKILKLMQRPYEIENIIKILLQLKHEVPSLLIGTHLLMGFPGETEEDFQFTLNLVKNVPFDFLNVFNYTDHKKAQSYSFSNKIPTHIIKGRSNLIFKAFYETYYLRNKNA